MRLAVRCRKRRRLKKIPLWSRYTSGWSEKLKKEDAHLRDGVEKETHTAALTTPCSPCRGAVKPRAQRAETMCLGRQTPVEPSARPRPRTPRRQKTVPCPLAPVRLCRRRRRRRGLPARHPPAHPPRLRASIRSRLARAWLRSTDAWLCARDGVRRERAHRPARRACCTRARCQTGRGAEAEEPAGRFAVVGAASSVSRESASARAMHRAWNVACAPGPARRVCGAACAAPCVPVGGRSP